MTVQCSRCKKNFPATRMREVNGDGLDRVYSAQAGEMTGRNDSRRRALLFMTSGVRLQSGENLCGSCHGDDKKKMSEAILLEDWDKRKEG